MSNSNVRTLSVMSWNVRGLDDPDKCKVVRDSIQAAGPAVACLQESKLQDITNFKAKTFLTFKLSETFLSSTVGTLLQQCSLL